MVWRAVELARKLRKNLTPDERILWKELRNRKLEGYKFQRQYIIKYGICGQFFIVDFYCHEKRLIIEIDGPIHNFTKENDQNRELILYDLGLRIIRFKNEEINDLKKVLDKIREELSK